MLERDILEYTYPFNVESLKTEGNCICSFRMYIIVSCLLSILCLFFDYLHNVPYSAYHLYYFRTNCRFASPGKNRDSMPNAYLLQTVPTSCGGHPSGAQSEQHCLE